MKKEIMDIKKLILLVLIGVVSFWLLNNLSIIVNILKVLFDVLKPFIIGAVLAFILNIPMKKIETILKKKINNKDGLVRVLSIIISVVLLILVLLVVSLLIIPKLVDNLTMLIENIPTLVNNFQNFILDLLNKYPDIQEKIKETLFTSKSVSDLASNVLNYLLNGAVLFISGLVNGVITIFTAIIFSVYILSQKEYLIRACKKVIYSITSKKKALKVINLASLSNNVFTKFISGQCLESVILAVLMFIALSIFRLPYASLIAVLTGITSLIPVFGAFLAAIIGFILISITNPLKSVVFIIVFVVIQQIEGNFIYPKVVGKSVGLLPMWALLAVTVGGNLFGIPGMIIGLPITSILYSIIKEIINNQLKKKHIEIS